MSEYDREKWQAEESERELAQTAYRDKMARARKRSAANAKRKITRLHTKLTELGHISDFEDEFGESVLERLEKFGSAFHDREKGRAGDALSIAQKQVVARMNRKVKELKAKQNVGDGASIDPDAGYIRTADRWKNDSQKERVKKRGLSSKRNSKFTPRVRHIEDEISDDPTTPCPLKSAVPRLVSETSPCDLKNRPEPFIPDYIPRPPRSRPSLPKSTIAKRPFLRVVPKA